LNGAARATADPQETAENGHFELDLTPS